MRQKHPAEVRTSPGKPSPSVVCCVLQCWYTGRVWTEPTWTTWSESCDRGVGVGGTRLPGGSIKYSVSRLLVPCRPVAARFVSNISSPAPATDYMSMWTPTLSVSSPFFLFFIYAWLSMISCRSLRITDWQGFLVHWHIMTLQLLHRRGGGTFGQTEREAGMKQKLLIQVRIDLLYNHQN